MEELAFILGGGIATAIVVVIVTFMNSKQIKELNKQIEYLKSYDETIYGDMNNLENKTLDIIEKVKINQHRENEEIIRYVDSRVDKLEDKIYKNFDVKQTQSKSY